MNEKQKLKRPIERKVRFSKEENDLINSKINSSIYPNFQNFALHMLIQGEIKNIDYSELESFTHEVHRVGVNINQMARLANQFSDISSADIQQLKKELQELSEYIHLELNKLMQRKER